MEVLSKPKLTHSERETVIQLYNDRIPIVHIAEKFKVSRPTIYSIIEKVKRGPKKIDFYVEKNLENKDMMEPQTKTAFLGIVIDPENGSRNPKINKALLKGTSLLDVMTFIEVVDFKLNMTMFDYFWQVVVGNVTGLHVSTSVLEWFGYHGEFKQQKDAFLRILKRNNIFYRELTQKDKEIEQYPTIQEELQLVPSNVQHAKFLIMEPNDLKMAIMQLKTKNGHIIRQYYIDLEELLKLYVEYTLYFNHREASRKITDLEQMMVDLKLDRQKDREIMLQQTQYMKSLGISLEEVKDQNEELLDRNKGLKKNVKCIQRKLGIAVEDRAPLPLDESKHERFVLIKRNDPDFLPYYTIRAQNMYTNRKIKVQLLHFPEMEILLDFKAHPNSKTLYNRIKETLRAKGVIFEGNNVELNDAITQDELMDEMKVINDQKYSV